MVWSSSMKTMMRPSSMAIFLQHRLEPLFELAAILGPASSAGHVQRQHPLALEGFLGHFVVDDALRQSFHDGGLADARLADQHRVVLGPALQDLDRTADFVVTADHRIELAHAGPLGEIEGVFLQRLALPLGLLAAHVGPPRTASIAASSALRFRPCSLRRRPASPLSRPARQEHLAGDELVAAFCASLSVTLRRLARSRPTCTSPPCPSTFGRRSMAFCRGGAERTGIHPRALQQRLGAAIVLAKQCREQVQRLDELLIVAHRNALCIREGLLELGGELVEAHDRKSLSRSGLFRSGGCAKAFQWPRP